ncbi:MAG: hypothetical protein B7C24_07390 [Bacteroidetes bacterium 4572_77]|nr:MAG: hypothetical protein B7C24_07390 [Bacteroidetes bacterium 4572_77]
MNPEELGKLKIQIKSKIDRLTRQVKELQDLTQPIAPDCAIGRVSRMDAINNKSINESALRKKENTLNRLFLAMDDIDKPDFENCIVCGFPIQKERIFIMPESRKCMNCARKSIG